MRRALRTSAIVLLAALAQCSESHGLDSGRPDAPIGGLGRCPTHCSWDEGVCPTEPPTFGTTCTPGARVWCAYCRAGVSFDEVTAICEDGRWRSGACGCPCP
jgi:hypothetical protein